MSFLNEVKNLHNIVRKGVRDSSLDKIGIRMTLQGLFKKPLRLTLITLKKKERISYEAEICYYFNLCSVSPEH